MKVVVELQLLDNWQGPRRARFYHLPRIIQNSVLFLVTLSRGLVVNVDGITVIMQLQHIPPYVITTVYRWVRFSLPEVRIMWL